MSVVGAAALAVAERLERTGGARAGLVAWRTLASNAADPEVRARAILAALRCAIAVDDRLAIGDFSVRWESIDHGVWDDAIVALAVMLEQKGMLASARELAEIEARRNRTARSLYLRSRLVDLCRGDATEAFRETTERAEKEGAREIELAARVRRAQLLARSWTTMTEALSEATRAASAPELTPEARLVVARILLRSPSRFVRASALGVLDDLVQNGGPESLDDPARNGGVVKRALAVAARFVDEVGDALTPLEMDRLVALFGREKAVALAPKALPMMKVLAQGDLEAAPALDGALETQHARARDLAAGRFESAASVAASIAPRGDARAVRFTEVLDVIAALRDSAPARAIHPLRRLAAAEEAGERVPREVLFAAELALGSEDAELRHVAVRVFRARLVRAEAGAPPAGYLALANALTLAGAPADVAALARHAAAVMKEAGAVDALGVAIAREGWELWKQGDRAAALARLRAARAAFGR